MKLLRYRTSPNVSMEVEEYQGKSYLMYKECSDGLELEVTLDDSLVDEAKEALEGELPDSLLSVLGISVSGETLEEVCEELRNRGLKCEMKVEETDNKYCESIYVELGAPSGRAVKVVIERGELSVRPAKSRKYYVKCTCKEGKPEVLEAVVPASVLGALGNNDKTKSLVASVVPVLKDVDLCNLVEVVEALETEDSFSLYIEKKGGTVSWRLE